MNKEELYLTKEEYYSRMEKMVSRERTDRTSIEEDYHISVQKNYLSSKYIKTLEAELELRENALKREHEAIHRANVLEDKIQKAIEYIKSLNSKGRDCEIYYDIKKEILSYLESSDE